MEFNPSNNVVKLCLQGMNLEEQGKPEEAGRIFLQAWDEATNDFEKYLAAYKVALHQKTIPDKLKWLETALQFALRINDVAVKSALPTLYVNLAKCYEDLSDFDNGPFYHGTKADLQIGDVLTPGSRSNYNTAVIMNHIYFTALVNGAGLAAALANGDGRERVYIVEPTGSFENDPNVTDKKFPGNPTRSYRTQAPLKIVGEATDWVRQTPEELKTWREKLGNLKGTIIN